MVVIPICLECLHLDSSDACPQLINELFRDYNQTLYSPLLLAPYTHPNPRCGYTRFGHVYLWAKDNGTPVTPGCRWTLEGFRHSFSHQFHLQLFYLEPNSKIVLQTVFTFLLFPFEVVSGGVKHTLFCPPGQIQPFFSDSVHQVRWSWATGWVVGLCSPALFQPLWKGGLFCVSCGLCLVLLWVTKRCLRCADTATASYLWAAHYTANFQGASGLSGDIIKGVEKQELFLLAE